MLFCHTESEDREAGVLQTFDMDLKDCGDAQHLRFVINDAFDHFCCVRSVEVR